MGPSVTDLLPELVPGQVPGPRARLQPRGAEFSAELVVEGGGGRWRAVGPGRLNPDGGAQLAVGRNPGA